MIKALLLIAFCTGVVYATAINDDPDYKAIAEKLVSQFPVKKDADMKIKFKSNLTYEGVNYDYEFRESWVTGLDQFNLTSIRRGAKTEPDESSTLHDLEFYVNMGRLGVKATVDYWKHDTNDKKTAKGAAASRDADWIWLMLLTIDMSDKTVKQCISVPTQGPHLQEYKSEGSDGVIAQIDKKITLKRHLLYRGVSNHINASLEGLKW